MSKTIYLTLLKDYLRNDLTKEEKEELCNRLHERHEIQKEWETQPSHDGKLDAWNVPGTSIYFRNEREAKTAMFLIELNPKLTYNSTELNAQVKLLIYGLGDEER